MKIRKIKIFFKILSDLAGQMCVIVERNMKPANCDFLIDAVDKYSNVILRVAFQYVRNRQDAEDLVQEVFLALMSQPPLDNDDDHLKAWLIRVTINKSKNFLREAKKRKSVSMDDDRFDFSEADRETFKEINKLPEKDRNIIYLFYIEGYRAKEIGEIIGKKENAVHARLKRARERLKHILEEN